MLGVSPRPQRAITAAGAHVAAVLPAGPGVITERPASGRYRRWRRTATAVLAPLFLAGCGSLPAGLGVPFMVPARAGTPGTVPISKRIVGEWQRVGRPRGRRSTFAMVVNKVFIYPISKQYYVVEIKVTGAPPTSTGADRHTLLASAFLLHSGKSLVLDLRFLSPAGFSSLGSGGRSATDRQLSQFYAWRLRRRGYCWPVYGICKVTAGRNSMSVLPFDPKIGKRVNQELMHAPALLRAATSPRQLQQMLRNLAKKLYQRYPNGFGMKHRAMRFRRVKRVPARSATRHASE